MSFRFRIASLVAASLLVAVPVASAGIRARIDAADAVETALHAKYHRYLWTAACDQTAPAHFRCRFIGRRASHAGTGKATVVRQGRRYTVTLGTVRFR
ncbi:hypothetical protein NBH00_20280 [Paraconexibacter antarcticus]|uniref:Uncharacterized protein n=1 Tax=Paraconexibacter antarcticus TaxID=2949664 RepID=A0ABY5DNR0_9ACTN|nr:hypothetical protein [Paraconexibacter antarcticus]UTI63668.1 hypothetical protein NBH00_20280 [Paraconexibacter antarcticus]